MNWLLLNRDVIIPGGTFVLVTLKSFLDAIHFKWLNNENKLLFDVFIKQY